MLDITMLIHSAALCLLLSKQNNDLTHYSKPGVFYPPTAVRYLIVVWI